MVFGSNVNLPVGIRVTLQPDSRQPDPEYGKILESIAWKMAKRNINDAAKVNWLSGPVKIKQNVITTTTTTISQPCENMKKFVWK